MVWAVNPNLTGEQVVEIVLETADRPVGLDGRLSYPIVNAAAAVEHAAQLQTNPLPEREPSGILMGNVVSYYTNEGIEGGVQVVVFSEDVFTLIASTSTALGRTPSGETTGELELVLPASTYRIFFFPPAPYLPKQMDVNVIENNVTVLAPVTLRRSTPDDPSQGEMEGSGTETNPYIIMNARQLYNVRNNLSAHYRLGANIELSGVDWTPIGGVGLRQQAFTGSLDGNGFVISNMRIIDSNRSERGLFGALGNDASIRNVTLRDIYIDGGETVGGIAALVVGTVTIENCHVSGEILNTTSTAGGIVGEDRHGLVTISNSTNSAMISALETASAGGILGSVRRSNTGDPPAIIERCVNMATVKAGFAGGIRGTGLPATIRWSYNIGSIEGISAAGGISAMGANNISESYNAGSITANGYAGGIIGRTGVPTVIENSINFGSVESTHEFGLAGGIAGRLDGSHTRITTNLMNVGNIRGRWSVGGIAGRFEGILELVYNSGSITGVTHSTGSLIGHTNAGFLNDGFYMPGTAERAVGTRDLTAIGRLHARTLTGIAPTIIYASWDFGDVWSIDPNVNNGLPFLSSTIENTP